MTNYDYLFNSKKTAYLQDKDIDTLKDYLLKKQGWVYIAYSDNNSLLKIGRTGKNPLERAKSLSSTGVLYDYDILFALPVFNQFIVEKKVHQKLKKFRISKEFFSVNKDTAISTIQAEYENEMQLLKRFINIDMIREDLDLLEHALINNT